MYGQKRMPIPANLEELEKCLFVLGFLAASYIVDETLLT